MYWAVTLPQGGEGTCIKPHGLQSPHAQPRCLQVPKEHTLQAFAASNTCLKFRKLERPTLMFCEASSCWDQPRNKAPPSKNFGNYCLLYTVSWRSTMVISLRKALRSPAASSPASLRAAERSSDFTIPVTIRRPPAGPVLQGTAPLPRRAELGIGPELGNGLLEDAADHR